MSPLALPATLTLPFPPCANVITYRSPTLTLTPAYSTHPSHLHPSNSNKQLQSWSYHSVSRYPPYTLEHLTARKVHPHTPTMAYVAVVKALYDYAAQDPETELALKEDQICYIIEKEDEEWVFSCEYTSFSRYQHIPLTRLVGGRQSSRMRGGKKARSALSPRPMSKR